MEPTYEELQVYVEQLEICLKERKAVCHQAFDANEALKTERDALQAQVEALRSAVIAVRDVPKRSGFQVNDPNPKAERLAWMRLNEVLAATPQHHLAELRAEAVKDFIEFMYTSKDCQLCSESLDKANQYAEQIRQEGE